MTHMIHRNLRNTPPTAVCAFGMYMRDSNGNTYIDASGGAPPCHRWATATRTSWPR